MMGNAIAVTTAQATQPIRISLLVASVRPNMQNWNAKTATWVEESVNR
jgi:hypothetical protein